VSGAPRALLALARAHGVQSSYVDVIGRRRTTRVEPLMAVLSALGEELERPEDAEAALERLRAEQRQRALEPVLVAWDGRLSAIEVCLPARAPGRLTPRVELEGGEERSWSVRTEDVATGEGVATLELDGELPFGRHALSVELGARVGTATVLAAPKRLALGGERGWGVFLPLHELVTDGSWGIGDLRGLSDLAEWVRGLGGGLVATLPLLACFPGDPSPYSPVSRLFWNEIYADVSSLPELSSDQGLRRLVRGPRFARELASARSGDLVDHDRVLRLKREVLERAAAALERDGGDRADAFARWARSFPELETYARFRAAGERFGRNWRTWPGGARDGVLRPSDVDPDAVRYHRIAQWVMEGQLADLGRRTREGGHGLYLDMPLGSHPDGYDVWRHRTTFAEGVSVGAPPDALFSGGQDWGFPPLHPERVRRDGYAYPIACLRHAFRHAGVARLDHVIGLHRQLWVPHGTPATEGVFVRYRPQEWYAAILLEAHRTGTIVVGEDLGTVPREVRAGVDRHRLLRSYVLELEDVPERRPPIPLPRANALASLNTHDLPTFPSFWRGLDIGERLEDGLLEPGEVDAERRRRSAQRAALVRLLVDAGLLRERDGDDERAVLSAALIWLATSPAHLVVVSLDDLLGETRRINTPGIMHRPNWRGRAARSLEELRDAPDVLGVLRRVDAARGELDVTLEKGDAA
jgi:4-alpha-glucanotransferase